MNEIWKDIEGYEGSYQISSLGRVKSFMFDREKILKPFHGKKGYLHVSLWKDGNMKTCRVHRLVALTFIPNPDNLPEINHRDENKSNNKVENLEWCTSEYNINYGSHNERMSKAQRNDPDKSKKVYQYSKDKQTFIREWPSTIEIERQLGYSHQNISKCCTGKYKSAYKYVWSFSKF